MARRHEARRRSPPSDATVRSEGVRASRTRVPEGRPRWQACCPFRHPRGGVRTGEPEDARESGSPATRIWDRSGLVEVRTRWVMRAGQPAARGGREENGGGGGISGPRLREMWIARKVAVPLRAPGCGNAQGEARRREQPRSWARFGAPQIGPCRPPRPARSRTAGGAESLLGAGGRMASLVWAPLLEKRALTR